MALYSVEMKLSYTMVVVADDEYDARNAALRDWQRALNESPDLPDANVRDEVTHERMLRDGWDGNCVPYGGDGNTTIAELLPAT